MNPKKYSQTWQHLGAYSRFREEPAELFTKAYYEQIINRTKPYYYACSIVNLAHVLMLVEEKIIETEIGAKILEAMLEMDGMGAETFPFEKGKGNIYLNMESYLFNRLGEAVGGWAYIGRSRLDYEATIRRVFVRDRILKVMAAILMLIDTTLDRALAHSHTIMPGYSHLQQSQPCTFGHYLLSFADAFLNDLDRFRQAFLRTNSSPLGAAAGVGESLKLNRKRTAVLLGFKDFIENAREACFSRDYALESISCCSIFMSNLGQLATDLDSFCTREFDMIELSDAFSGTSSFMPQKKNPLPLEAIRAASGYFIGMFPAMLGVMKTNSEEVDIIEFTPDFNLDSFQMLIDMAELMEGTIGTLIVKELKMKENVRSNWSSASALAERISLGENLPWRTAHRIVGRMIRDAVEQGISPVKITKQMLDKASKEILGRKLKINISASEIRTILDPGHFVHTRTTAGSTNPDEVKRMAENRMLRVKQQKKWLEINESKIIKSYVRLRKMAGKVFSAQLSLNGSED